MEIYSKKDLILRFKEIYSSGWIPEGRSGNQGSAGNTLEDLLGIKENNLPIPNAAEWELKTHKHGSTALTTLLHSEPSPRALKLVPSFLLPNFGWKHQQAGIKYPQTELSFRQTISAHSFSDRGFKIDVDRASRKIKLIFDATQIKPNQKSYLELLEGRFGSINLIQISKSNTPYWGFDDLFHAMGVKLTNAFFVDVEERNMNGIKEFKYSKVTMLRQFDIEHFLSHLENGSAFIDFDARTGHNHGTKFRIRSNKIVELYNSNEVVVP